MAYADAEPMTQTDGVNFGEVEAAAYRKEAEAIACMRQLKSEVAYEVTVEKVYGLPETDRHKMLQAKLENMAGETFL